ncbi:DUF1778 domain-containing protein [Gloeobacter violaceus]|nr:DUF1778 domain-containing protein [Gloeobacter violaceus]
MTPEPQTKTERIDIRTTPAAKRALQETAAIEHKTVSGFLLDSGLKASAQILADRWFFLLDDKRWEVFVAAFNASPKEHQRLRQLLSPLGVLLN